MGRDRSNSLTKGQMQSRKYLEKLLLKNLERQIPEEEDKDMLQSKKNSIREEIAKVVNNPSTDLKDIQRLGGELSEKLAQGNLQPFGGVNPPFQMPTTLPDIGGHRLNKRGKYYRNDMVSRTDEFATEHQFTDPVAKETKIRPLDKQAVLLQSKRIGGHHRYKSVNLRADRDYEDTTIEQEGSPESLRTQLEAKHHALLQASSYKAKLLKSPLQYNRKDHNAHVRDELFRNKERQKFYNSSVKSPTQEEEFNNILGQNKKLSNDEW